MTVIFLDFDGVLNNPGTWGLRPLETEAVDADKVALLSDLVEKLDAQIVVSSTWRYSFTVEQFQQMLAAKGLLKPERVIDVTPMPMRDEYRGVDIKAWLKEHDTAEYTGHAPIAFAILDDMGIDQFEGLGGHLVQTDGSVGLTADNCRWVERTLARQLRLR